MKTAIWTVGAAALACALPVTLRAEPSALVERRELGELRIEGVPEIPGALRDRMRQYLNVRGATVYGWAEDGRGLLIGTRFAETSQLHYVAQPLGARRQLTFFDERVAGFSVAPNGREGILLRDVGGGEFFQLYHYDVATARTTLITDGQSRNGGVNWSDDGRQIVYTSTRRNGRDSDLYLANPRGAEGAAMIREGGVGFASGPFSPDGQKLLVARYFSAVRSEFYVRDLATGAETPVEPRGEGISYGGAEWAVDGRSLFLTCDHGSQFTQLRRYDLATGAHTVLTADLPWDVESMELTPAGDLLAFTVNADGASALYLLDTASGNRRQVALEPGVVGALSWSPDGSQLACVHNTARSPSDVWTVGRDGTGLTRWTESEVGGLDPDQFATPELVRFPTFDEVDGARRTIPAWVYRPAVKGPRPVLIQIHGGPEGQSRPTFNSTFQFYVNELGLAVIDPNVRGSSGYGRDYLNLDNGRLREDSVRDIGALLDWIATQPDLDARRVIVVGGSYGGYMVNACMVHYSDRLAGGISVVGISNFVTFLENTQDYRRDLRRVEYGDESDPAMRAFLQSISPLTHAHKIAKPMFIIQGYNDPRVPYTESEQLVAAVRGNGQEVWYLLAMNEGHGFAKKGNADYQRLATVLFLERFLLSGQP